MKRIAYDPSRDALYRPGEADDFFAYPPYDTDAGLCAEMARVAYVKTPGVCEGHLREAGYRLVYFSPNGTGTQLFVAVEEAGDRGVVAFRGTERDDPTDIVTDLEFPRIPWQTGGKVHRGFAQALEDAWPAIEEFVAHASRRWLLTGHSLGAALATLTASRLGTDRYHHLYTFGSPLIGDTAFAETVPADRHARYVNCCDVVARVPPPVLGFRHSGQCHYIDRDARVHATASSEEGWINLDRLQAHGRYLLHADIVGGVALRELADHAPINYLSGVLGRREKRSPGRPF